MSDVNTSLSFTAVETDSTANISWFCVRSQPKHEHIAAAHLRQLNGVDVLLPRVRFKRATKRGPAWTTEAVFPGYLFARFDFATMLRAVQCARGVSGIVRFGIRWPVISPEVIEEIKSMVGPEELHVISSEIQPGEAVLIADGSLRGLRTVVTRVMSGGKRVAVLMEFLGRQTQVELPSKFLVRDGDARVLHGF